MEFADRASLVVPFDPDFEGWTVAAPEGFKAVSVAGGGLAVWDGNNYLASATGPENSPRLRNRRDPCCV